MRLIVLSGRRWLFARCGSLLHDDGGAVLMEYVVLSLVMLGVLVGLDVATGVLPTPPLFNFEGTVTGQDFGLFGNAFMDWYHRIVDTIALPVP